ncbi:MAG: universal stress protein family protein [Proteobacteria bacterium]|nr:MAG: universal stress protein family protein [Pseudomonadota bacterium]PIE66854.1 MAG: universal stress protein family protein [Deltaproteobacteria bacterium]
MDIKKLLFVTRFETLRFDALQSLMDLKKAALDHVVFLNVIERDKVALRRGKGYEKSAEIRLREKANIRFIDWAETLFEQGMEVGVYIVVGSYASQVIQTAEKEDVDLIVLSPEKKNRLEQFYSGSDITQIVHRAATPVLVYKYLSRRGPLAENPFEKPLLATNWSSSSQQAVEYLKSLKSVVREIDVVHVASDKDLKSPSAMGIQKTRKENRRKLDALCDELEDAGIDARPHVYIGETVAEIDKAARECQSSMIIAGSPRKGLWQDRWGTSISRGLAEQSVFPILLIPPVEE